MEVAIADRALDEAFDAERAETIRARSRWIWAASIPVWILSFFLVDQAVFTPAQALALRLPECLLAAIFLVWLRTPKRLRVLEGWTVAGWALIATMSSIAFFAVPPDKLPVKVAALVLSVLVVVLLASFTWRTTFWIAMLTLASLSSLLFMGATSLYKLTVTAVGFAYGVIAVSAAARDRLKRAELAARRALVEANERLKREDDLKRRLFVNLSHDLRTPLAIVRGEASMLRASGRFHEDDAALFRVERNASALAQLADQLLDLARLEAGQMPVNARPSDVKQLVRELATQLAPPGEPRIVTRLPEESVVAHVDPTHASRILTNLVANALRQSRPDGTAGVVHVDVSKAGDEVLVDVIDEGPGIPPERRDVIFERFVSFDSDGSTTSGIGLPLARELAVLNGGSLVLRDRAESAGKTTFRLSLSATNAPAEPAPAAEAPIAPPRADDAPRPEPTAPKIRRRVLVVEDNADMGALIVRALGAQYRVEHVTRVADALALLREDPPAAVLSDVLLPDGTGYDVLGAIRKKRELDRLPVVLVSALGEVDERIRGLAAGADDYVPKPFAPEELRSRVSAAIERAETWGEALAAQRDALLMEVHDGVSASLSRASMLLSDLEPHLAPQTVSYARDAIRDGLDEVRAITRLLAPRASRWDALTAEIRRAMADACAAGRLELDFEASDGDLSVSAALAHTLRRVAREAMTNVVKHAAARTVVCRISATSEELALKIEDDGRGLPDGPSEGQGLGIMRRRVARVGGTIVQERREEGGTRVEVRLPRIGGAR